MSKIALKSNDSGTGTFTIESPPTNTNRTLELPDEAGKILSDDSPLAAGKLTGDIAADRMKDGFNAGGSAPVFACRAWVNFDGTTSPGTIRASGNVSSVTRNGTADYTINFTTSMPDANYQLSGICLSSVAVDGNNFQPTIIAQGGEPYADVFLVSSVRIQTVVGRSLFRNEPAICVSIHR